MEVGGKKSVASNLKPKAKRSSNRKAQASNLKAPSSNLVAAIGLH